MVLLAAVMVQVTSDKRCNARVAQPGDIRHAIESGIVKIPRVPVADNAMTGDQPTYRDLWLRIRDVPLYAIVVLDR